MLVFAAASLTDVLQQAGPLYTKQSNVPVKFSFAASSALAKQIESGAQADAFLSADQDWMNYLQERKLIKAGTRSDLLGNRLVLIAPKDSKVTLKLQKGAPLLAALGPNGRLSTGDPDSVPVGKYAKTALGNLDLWSAIEPRLVRADNVRVALMYVARGEAPLGIVYAHGCCRRAAGPRRRCVPRVVTPADHLSRRGNDQCIARDRIVPEVPARRRGPRHLHQSGFHHPERRHGCRQHIKPGGSHDLNSDRRVLPGRPFDERHDRESTLTSPAPTPAGLARRPSAIDAARVTRDRIDAPPIST